MDLRRILPAEMSLPGVLVSKRSCQCPSYVAPTEVITKLLKSYDRKLSWNLKLKLKLTLTHDVRGYLIVNQS